MNEKTESQLLELIATDRLHIPLSSLDGKLKRSKPKLASAIELPVGNYQGQRVYARVVAEDNMKTRGMSEAVTQFCEAYPKPGEVLTQMIEDQRSVRETHLYFGMNAGCRLTADDYLGVMAKLGFTEAQARALYGPLIETSNRIARKRDEERSILVE